MFFVLVLRRPSRSTLFPSPTHFRSNIVTGFVAANSVLALLSPPAVLFHVAVIVSPILKVPPVPVAPLIVIRASVNVGSMQPTVAVPVQPIVDVFLAVAVTDTYALRL